MTLLGVGPFTTELATMFGNTKKKLLFALYPLTAIAGISRSFKELTSTILTVIIDNYLRKGIQIREEVFKTKMNDLIPII